MINNGFYKEKNLIRKLKKMDIYVVRVTGKTTSPNICKSDPCKDCLNFIKNMGIRNIIFSTNDEEVCKVKVCDLVSNYTTKGKKRMLDENID